MRNERDQSPVLEKQPLKPDVFEPDDPASLFWNATLKASEINNPSLVDSIFATEPVIGQTTLPWEGKPDMEIRRVGRTASDSIRSAVEKAAKRAAIEEVLLKIRQQLAEGLIQSEKPDVT